VRRTSAISTALPRLRSAGTNKQKLLFIVVFCYNDKKVKKIKNMSLDIPKVKKEDLEKRLKQINDSLEKENNGLGWEAKQRIESNLVKERIDIMKKLTALDLQKVKKEDLEKRLKQINDSLEKENNGLGWEAKQRIESNLVKERIDIMKKLKAKEEGEKVSD
jgi:uncharacterized FlaG/YvyC family protein